LPCGQRLRVFPIPYHPPLLERRLPQGIPANPLITSSEVRLENAAKDVSVLSEIGASNICENGRIAAGEPTIFFRLVSH